MKGDFRLGQWLVQPQLNRVSSSKQSTALEPKMMELLVYLAGRYPEVVSKDRLIHAVWSDSHVGDEALTSSIYKLRQALEGDPKNPQIIETVPRRGYRLMTPARASLAALQLATDFFPGNRRIGALKVLGPTPIQFGLLLRRELQRALVRVSLARQGPGVVGLSPITSIRAPCYTEV